MAADPKLYRELSQPFASTEEANAALEAFFADVGEARKKHKIANVYCIVGLTITVGENEGDVITSFMYGDQLKGETLTAWALGHEQSRQQERIAEMLSKPIRKKKE